MDPSFAASRKSLPGLGGRLTRGVDKARGQKDQGVKVVKCVASPMEELAENIYTGAQLFSVKSAVFIRMNRHNVYR